MSAPPGHPAPVRTLIVDDEPPARRRLRALLEQRDDVTVVGECGDGRAAVQQILAEAPELVLLDIQMPELDGLGVVREVGTERMPVTVFVTAYDDHALEAFDARAIDYLVKPVDRERFARAIDRAVSLVRAGVRAEQQAALDRIFAESVSVGASTPSRIAIRAGGKVTFLPVADVDWVEAADDHVRFHVGKASYLHRATLSALAERLPPNFMRIHRSVIVNVERIRELQPWFQGDWVAILHDGTRLTTGRSYRDAVRGYVDRQL